MRVVTWHHHMMWTLWWDLPPDRHRCRPAQPQGRRGV